MEKLDFHFGGEPSVYKKKEKNYGKIERAIGKYEKFFILKCDYSKEVGVEFLKEEKKGQEAGQEDSFF